MVIQGLVIVLVILILANMAVGFLNQVSPPCYNAQEFFKGATLLQDGAEAGLGSIPTHSQMDFVGARRVAAGPGVIGLTSYVKKDQFDINNFTNHTLDTLGEETPVSKQPEPSADVTNTMDALLGYKKKDEKKGSRVESTDKRNTLSELDVGMSEFVARVADHRHSQAKHAKLTHETLRDGYS